LQQKRQIILLGSVEKTYPSGHGGGGGGPEVVGAVDAAGLGAGAGAGEVGELLLGPPMAAKRTVQEKLTEWRWCSEPVLLQSDPESQLVV
jgi:hypothetical protein